MKHHCGFLNDLEDIAEILDSLAERPPQSIKNLTWVQDSYKRAHRYYCQNSGLSNYDEFLTEAYKEIQKYVKSLSNT